MKQWSHHAARLEPPLDWPRRTTSGSSPNGWMTRTKARTFRATRPARTPSNGCSSDAAKPRRLGLVGKALRSYRAARIQTWLRNGQPVQHGLTAQLKRLEKHAQAKAQR
jgi:hypothetical protein